MRLNDTGELIRHFERDPTRDYQPKNEPDVSNASRHQSPMSRDITLVLEGGLVP